MRWSEKQLAEYQTRRGSAGQTRTPEPPPRAETGGKVIRQSRKGPNKTEARFELERLAHWLRAGLIRKYTFEAITLKIANGCKYTPDYWAITFDGRTVFYEIKARRMIWDDAIVKLKVAAATYADYSFSLCAYEKGEWTIQEVLP